MAACQGPVHTLINKYQELCQIFSLKQLITKVVNEIAPSKEIRIKNNTQERFDRDIAELIHALEKLFLKFKKSKLHIDEENFKKLSIKFKI